MPIIKLYLLIFIALNGLVILLFQLGALSNLLFFYRGIALIGIVSLVTGGGFLIARKKFLWRSESIVAATLLAGNLHLAFFVVGPVTLDRSISIFLLQNIRAQDEGLTKQQLTDSFIAEYVYTRDAIGRRMLEQTRSHNIEVANQTIKLTRQGYRFLHIADFIKWIYGI